jgi:hypothetical protein
MPKFVTYPPATQLNVLATQLAKLAKVPLSNQREFSARITNVVLSVRGRDRRSTNTKPGGLLVEAADAAKKLDEAFFSMNETDREWVEHIKLHEGVLFGGGEIDSLQATITNISVLLHTALGKPPPQSKHLRFGAHKVRDLMLQELVRGLLSAAEMTGGKFTLDKDRASGTLVNAMDRLRKHLPSGLVTRPLRFSTIKRLKDDFFQQSRL